PGSTAWDCPGSHDLNLSNRPVRTRMPGGVAGAQSMRTVPYADVREMGAASLQNLFMIFLR
ncbi:hypothetical protein, partial [Stutzerimonas kirkiae]|uniref:hypothetical protein n=1 Tax=Stutzerimonas kirkiae TaxID=2211392 RepID=UPI001A9556D2